MGGGSWEYLHEKVEAAANRLEGSADGSRRALGRHLYFVARALHDIEMVDSSDMPRGSEMEAILLALGNRRPTLSTENLIEEARLVMEQMGHLITALIGKAMEDYAPDKELGDLILKGHTMIREMEATLSKLEGGGA